MKKIYYSLLLTFAAMLFSPVEAIEQWRQDQRDTTLLSEFQSRAVFNIYIVADLDSRAVFSRAVI